MLIQKIHEDDFSKSNLSMKKNDQSLLATITQHLHLDVKTILSWGACGCIVDVTRKLANLGQEDEYIRIAGCVSGIFFYLVLQKNSQSRNELKPLPGFVKLLGCMWFGTITGTALKVLLKNISSTSIATAIVGTLKIGHSIIGDHYRTKRIKYLQAQGLKPIHKNKFKNQLRDQSQQQAHKKENSNKVIQLIQKGILIEGVCAVALTVPDLLSLSERGQRIYAIVGSLALLSISRLYHSFNHHIEKEESFFDWFKYEWKYIKINLICLTLITVITGIAEVFFTNIE